MSRVTLVLGCSCVFEGYLSSDITNKPRKTLVKPKRKINAVCLSAGGCLEKVNRAPVSHSHAEGEVLLC